MEQEVARACDLAGVTLDAQLRHDLATNQESRQPVVPRLSAPFSMTLVRRVMTTTMVTTATQAMATTMEVRSCHRCGGETSAFVRFGRPFPTSGWS